ncbi:hypothetical protein UFOVP73_25 [uncultured Caudovirales phage]|uniref:Uncharacterized protein n=1 Tax=uncultured Caudovirales phage TaxID=2100421 RepID=A0A6J7WCU9_9CAUD|nr:hypothetical protein UFOVP73_25 [uncultured Caudovirales phage]CAB5195098.1 hypothetical protein UFOVP170_47 [uncultured Caudovirales phage]
MKHAPFEPAWYELRMRELKQLAEELKVDPHKTWHHPADWLIVAIGFAAICCACLGLFA